MTKKPSPVVRYWGYLLLIFLITAWWTDAVGSAGLLVLSALCLFYFGFQVPVWCGADGRKGSCRNNATGILMGCHLREHKWQLLKGAFFGRRWRELNKHMWSTSENGIASVSAIAACLSVLVAAVRLVVEI